MTLSHKSLDNQHVSMVHFRLRVMISLDSPFCSAVRYCGATFTFTSVSILLNYSTWLHSFLRPCEDLNLSVLVTPPQTIGLANGVAQSIVSLARGFGPLLGGYVYVPSLSI